MRVTQIRIQNCKSVKDSGWVPIENDITTLLGRNESGKTSFLEAIRYFDEDREIQERELYDGKDYPKNHSVPIASLRVELNSEAVDRFSGGSRDLNPGDEIIATKYSDGTRDLSTPRGKELGEYVDPIKEAQETVEEMWQELNNLRNQHSGNYRNHFDNQIKQPANRIRNNEPNENQAKSWVDNLLEGLQNIPEENKEIANAKERWVTEVDKIRSILVHINEEDDPHYLLPPIVYHGGFDTISDDVQVNSISSDDHRTFRNLLKIVDLDNDNFDNLDYHDQNQALETAGGTIRGQVNQLWKQKEVDVDISYRDNRFMVGIKDTALGYDEHNSGSKRVSRTLKRPSDRSKGFQWFFSFYINLRAETDSEDSPNQLILLDDPAVFLHPEGKKNWLKAIEELSETAQIIYSSHSPFLIRKEYPNRIRVVEDREPDGTVVTDDFHTSDEMTLEPLRNALGIGLGDSPFVSKRKILVEGVSDYDILIGLANYYRDHLGNDILAWDEITIMPTNGGNNMIQAAKWVASEEFSYVLLLDNDQKGKEVIQEIDEQHHEINTDRVVLLEKDDNERNFNIEIEDIFDPVFYIDCVNEAYQNQFDDFEPLDIEEHEEHWLIDGYEYKGRKIVNRIEDAFEERDMGDLDKILVANEIQGRLTNNRDVSESDIIEFNRILGQVRNLT